MTHGKRFHRPAATGRVCGTGVRLRRRLGPPGSGAQVISIDDPNGELWKLAEQRVAAESAQEESGGGEEGSQEATDPSNAG